MKFNYNQIILLLLFFITSNSIAQAPEIQWQKSLGGTDDEEATCIQQTSDGGYIIAGYSASNNGDVTLNHNFSDDFWIVKLSSIGVIEWQKSLGGSNPEFATSIEQTTDGGYIVAGYSYSNDGDVTGHHGTTSYADYWIVKLTSAGTITWQKSLGGDEWDKASSIQQTSDGGYIVAGDSFSTNGNVTGNHGLTDYWIVKLTSTGTIVWQKSFGGLYGEYARSIQQTADGGYIVSGSGDSLDGDVIGNHGLSDYWIVKISSTGLLEWQKSLGGSKYDICYSIQQTNDGGYIVAGDSASTNGDVTGNNGNNDYWIVKLTSTGSIAWQKSLGGSSYDLGRSIKQTTDGGYIVAGYSYSNDGDVTGNHGLIDYWIVKLSSFLGVNSFINNSTLTLFPNPANDDISVKLDYFTPSQEITITDVLGKTIYNQKLEGLTTTINTSSYEKGIYLFNLINGTEIITKKFIKE